MAVVERVATHQGWPLRGVPLYNIGAGMRWLDAGEIMHGSSCIN